MIKERNRLSFVSSILLILLSISAAVTGQVLIKIGINHIGIANSSNLETLKQLFFGAIKSPLIISGLFLYVVSAAIWMVVLTAVDLSFAYPFIGLTYVVILILSRFILKEDVNPLRWAGAFIITIGVILISRG